MVSSLRALVGWISSFISAIGKKICGTFPNMIIPYYISKAYYQRIRFWPMVEGIVIGLSDILSIAQTVGIVGAMILTLYFSKKTIQSLSIDTQTRGLNDLGEKYLKMAERAMEDPSMLRVIDKEVKLSREEAYSFYILWVCSHAYAMRKRNLLDDDEWIGWLQWMRHIFQRGTIKESWKQIEPDRWFNPNFQNFINTEILGAKLQT